MDLVKTTVNRDLREGIPVFASIVRLTNLFIENPLLSFVNIPNIIKDMEIVRNLLATTNADTHRILRDLSVIADTLTRLLNSIISNPGG